MSGTHRALCLIELASARLCEALGGSVGVLNSALSSQSAGEAVHAAETLTNQLNLWHAAWGPADHPVPLQQIATLAHGLPERIAVDPSGLPAATVFSAAHGRVVLNLMLLAADSLPAGGRIILAGAADDLFIRIAGPAAAWPAGMALCLADEAEARSALTDGRSLQLALTVLLAREAGIRLSALLAPSNQTEPAILRLGG